MSILWNGGEKAMCPLSWAIVRKNTICRSAGGFWVGHIAQTATKNVKKCAFLFKFFIKKKKFSKKGVKMGNFCVRFCIISARVIEAGLIRV
ncbi:MAG: hypothetical protein ACYS1A_16920 [Planctomycetota bacterium]